MSGPTRQRDHVAAIARTDPDRALDEARRIDHPWFRCQALTSVALRMTSTSLQLKIIKEAFKAANELQEPNRIVTVSAWPLKALVLLGRSGDVDAQASQLIRVIAAEPSPVRRGDALREVFGAVITSGRPACRVAEALVSACLTPLEGGRRNRKGEYVLEECLPAITRLHPELANDVLSKIPASRAERARKVAVETFDTPIGQLVAWPYV